MTAWFRKIVEFSTWAGNWTFRCILLNRLWFGANLRTRKWFIIYYGRRHNWQVNGWPFYVCRWQRLPIAKQGADVED